MTEEVTTPPAEPVTEDAVDLKTGPADTSEATSDAGFQASAVEADPAQEDSSAASEEPPQADEPQSAPEPEGAEAWGDTGSEIGNSVLGMLQESGISTADAKALLFDAVQSGDMTKIDVPHWKRR